MNNLEASKVLEKIKLQYEDDYKYFSKSKHDKQYAEDVKKICQALSHALSLLKSECKLVPEEKEKIEAMYNGERLPENSYKGGRVIGWNSCRSLVLQNWIGVKGRLVGIIEKYFFQPNISKDYTSDKACIICGTPFEKEKWEKQRQACADHITDLIEKGK